MKAVLFDLDGTLIDSVYQHVQAWSEAFLHHGFCVPGFEIHRRVGMNAPLLIDALDRTFQLDIGAERKESIERAHARAFASLRDKVMLFDGADRISQTLERLGVGMAIVTSAAERDAQTFFSRLHLADSVICITRDSDPTSKPSASQIDRALHALRVSPREATLVGDSTWDMLASRLAGSLGVGVASGGYSREELAASGALRVYRDVSEFLARLEEIGITR